MARIDYAVHGHGRGHASCARDVVTRLLGAGHTVTLFAGGDGVSLLTQLCEVRPRSPILPGRRAIPAMLLRAREEVVRLLRERPDLVITDGDQAIVLGARRAHIPCLAIGHDLVFSACTLPSGLPRVSLAREQLNAFVPTHLANARIAVHFLPVESRLPATRVARALGVADRAVDSANCVSIRDDAHELGAVPTEPFLLVYVSEGDHDSVLARLDEANVDAVAFGDGLRARGRVRVEPISRERFAAHLREALAVVATAGSNVLAECVLLHKPVLALHSGRHHEQALNAVLVERAHVGEALRISELTAQRVRSFVARAAAGAFARVELAQALRPLDEVAQESVSALLQRS